MIRLWIDDRECDVATVPPIPLAYTIGRLTDIESAREGRTIELVLPATPANNAVLGSLRDLYAVERFNTEPHTACLKEGGVVIFEGTAYLISATIDSGFGGDYVLRIVDGGEAWVKRVARASLDELEINFEGQLNASTIEASWGEGQAVRFLPIYRNNYSMHYSESGLAAERVLLTDDYHPFISVAEMVRKMFEPLGYTLHSRFFEEELFCSLYMSGDYTRTDASAVKARCDFFARRSTPATATADAMGRVYASTAFATHSVGNIVDTANPNAVDSEGRVMRETFCKEDSFSKNSEGNICFTPSVAAKVGFVLHAEYTTDYKILSRDRLKGFDMIEGVSGVRATFALTNTCQDHRNSLLPNREYRAIVFDHEEGTRYQLRERVSTGAIHIMGEWDTRSAKVVTAATVEPVSAMLYCYDETLQAWVPYLEDWALYEGYIKEEGRIDVEVDVRFPPQEVAGGGSLSLDEFWFGGAEAGMSLTLGLGTTLRPYFTNVPGYNSLLNFKEVAPKGVRQIDLLAALGEMFNLAFLTDRATKSVYVEPLEELFDGEVVDWSDRVLLSSGIEISDIGIDRPQRLCLTYLDADAASQRFNAENNTTLGKWEFSNPLRGTSDTTRTLRNRLFTTTLTTSGVYGSAPSASLLAVGDAGAEGGGADEAFTSRIVCYLGLRDLPEGERWGGATNKSRYPYAAFVDDVATNLCYEERNGIEGLSRYYLSQLHRECGRQRIEVDMRLTTAEVMSLFRSDGTKPSVRAKFRLKIGGESSLFRLVGVGAWIPESGVLHCCFERELRDE